MKFKTKLFTILPILLFSLAGIVAVTCKNLSSEQQVDLKDGFLNPPESAKPREWWHWMNGNITREGIKADLEWMKRVGLGGFQNFDAGLATPQIVEKRLIYMTPEWKDAFLFTTKLADSLGLEMAIAGSPGWSESGGPWVTPAQAMKKLVWSEIRVEGGQPFNGVLPKPPTTTGKFQNIRIKTAKGSAPPMEYYKDAAVIAFRVPENDIAMVKLPLKVTSSGKKIDLASLSDGDLAKTTFLPATALNGKSWIQFEFSKSTTIQSVTIADGGFGGSMSWSLVISDDGLQFKKASEITSDGTPYGFVSRRGGSGQNTVTFPPVRARFFRVEFTTPPFRGDPTGTHLSELILHTSARVNRFEEKAGFTAAYGGLYSEETPSLSERDVINKKDIIDLTSKMQPDACTLNWTPPAGNWVVLRLGYSLTGTTNHPASPEATGLEVDKLSAEHVKSYFENYLDQYKVATGGMMGKKGLQYMISDSWEAGVQNWTDNMATEFASRRGYTILPWLPVLTGRVVESAESSDRFLWDFRKTISDLTAENHYDQLTTLLHKRDMGSYVESHERTRAFIADGMEVKRKADIPMGAFWTPRQVGGKMANVDKADVRETASASHIYGQNLVAAESMTSIGSPWAWSPEFLKPTADMELANGVNRFVISVSVHSPGNDKIPGLSLGPYGPWLNRHETWADKAKPWITYLARSSYMLQQGKFVADVLYFYGEDNNITALFGNNLPEIPNGYNYDFVNADALVNILSVKKGNIITPGGMSYRVLALDSNSRYMSMPVLLKISELVQSGAVVVGEKPVDTPSLRDDKSKFKAIVDLLWARKKGENNVGLGKVYSGLTIAEALASMKVSPDFEHTKSGDTTNLMFVHRRLDDTDIYWVSNCTKNVENIEATFRVDGKAPEIWHPETGRIEEASYTIATDRTIVPLRLEPNDAVFVVFRKNAKTASLKLVQPVKTNLIGIDGVWTLSFQPDRGAPAKIVIDQLTSWSDNADPGVKYFSGTGTYTKTFQSTSDWFKKRAQIWLDLGSVKNLAEVSVNGKPLGIVWKTPFLVNITDALKQGENALEVKVTNLWVNRLIGDQQPGNTKKITYTTQVFYKADSPLLLSGLLGPVKIFSLELD